MDGTINQQSQEEPKANTLLSGKYLIVIVSVAVIIAVGAYFLLSSNTQQANPKGTATSPYNPSQGYKGAGYYNISGQNVYISSQSQLNNALINQQTTPPTTQTITTATRYTTTQSTIPPKTSMQNSTTTMQNKTASQAKYVIYQLALLGHM